MGASLTERRRVCDEGLRVVKHCRGGGSRKVDLSPEEARAKFVPAAAVRRTVRTLFGITGLRARRRAGRSGVKSPRSTGERPRTPPASRKVGASGTLGGAVKCVDIQRNSGG